MGPGRPDAAAAQDERAPRPLDRRAGAPAFPGAGRACAPRCRVRGGARVRGAGAGAFLRPWHRRLGAADRGGAGARGGRGTGGFLPGGAAGGVGGGGCGFFGDHGARGDRARARSRRVSRHALRPPRSGRADVPLDDQPHARGADHGEDRRRVRASGFCHPGRTTGGGSCAPPRWTGCLARPGSGSPT